jgi:SAM-dependent methyltransferase
MKTSLYGTYVHQLSRLFVKKEDKVFDCGCGDGSKTNILMNYSDKVIGGDIDKRVDVGYGVDFRKIDCKKYGQENEFDVVFSFDVIEHIHEDLEFLQELVRITKSGGTIIVGTPNRYRLSNKIIILFKGEIKYPRNLGHHYESGGDIIHLREYTKEDLLKLTKEITNIKNIEVKSSFFGLYTSIGPIGLKRLDQKLFAKHAQHLFLILKKI